MKHLTSIEALEADEIVALVNRAAELKRNRIDPGFQPLVNQSWALIFTKSSTRTRVSFEVGIRELGGNVMFLSSRDLQLGRGEPIQDTARVMGRMLHGAVIRNDSQEELETFARASGIPTVNALTDREHPCQVLADLLTLRERKADWRSARICFLGDGDCNMARSWVWAASKLGLELTIGAPPEFQPPASLLEVAGGRVRVEADPRQAVAGCDVLYTDVWVSMGREAEAGDRLERLAPYQINAELLAAAGLKPLVMHCLPAYREKEITGDVLEAFADVIFDQAENRLHAQKAVLCRCVE